MQSSQVWALANDRSRKESEVREHTEPCGKILAPPSLSGLYVCLPSLIAQGPIQIKTL